MVGSPALRGQSLGEPDRWAVGEFCPASSPISSANPMDCVDEFPTHQTPLLDLTPAFVYKSSPSVHPELALALWLTMMDKGMVPRPVLKQNHVPMSSKGAGYLFNPQMLLPTHSSMIQGSKLGVSGSSFLRLQILGPKHRRGCHG